MSTNNRFHTEQTGDSLAEVCANTVIELAEKRKTEICRAYNSLLRAMESIDFDNEEFGRSQFFFTNAYIKGLSDAFELILSGELDIKLISRQLNAET